MKTSTNRLLLTACLVVLAMGLANGVQAQTVIKASVPFEFSLGGETLPSGVYTFTTSSGGEARTVLARNQSNGNGRFILAQVEDESASIDTAVTFNRYGKRYVMSSISIAGTAISLHIAPTKAEREMAAREPREVVSVMASR
jgi:hypothetical protein